VVRPAFLNLILVAGLLAGGSGCSLIVPTVAHKPVIRNPFPQLRRVAVAPFFNQSDEATLDGRKVAMAYFAELQTTPGFEVVPVGVVEEAMLAHRIDLSGPNEARRLAQVLGVDAVVIGSVTDFTEYYPPRLGLRIEWYAANEGYHEIPAGYGLPWNTPEEEFIPDSLVYESQMALAREQMKVLAPDCESAATPLPAPPVDGGANPASDGVAPTEAPAVDPAAAASNRKNSQRDRSVQRAQALEELPAGNAARGAGTSAPTATGATTGTTVTSEAPWLGAPCPPATDVTAARPQCITNFGPVLAHTKLYTGDDADFTEALEGYAFFRDDERFGGWKTYLSRSDDFIRFCCHMHISEMLSARGGSRKTQVVWQWPESR
jgi:hypothetical protein